jgi:hypothetical protein
MLFNYVSLIKHGSLCWRMLILHYKITILLIVLAINMADTDIFIFSL